MDHSILVAVIDRLQDLLDAVGGVSFRVELSGYDVLEQFSSRHPDISCVRLSYQDLFTIKIYKNLVIRFSLSPR